MRLAAVIVTGLLVAGCASTPKGATVTDRLAGSWNCDTKMGGADVKGVWTYARDGSVGADITVTGGGAIAVEAKGTLKATWRLESDDTKLVLQHEGVTVESATIAGNKVEPAMAQALVSQLMSGQSVSSRITVDDKNLVLTADDNSVVNCTRKP